MLNCFTNGTKYDASYYKPFNEDYIVVGKIKAFDGHQIVFCKVWDTTEKLYYAKPLLNANNTEVTALEDYFDIGEYSVFYRVGDFNSKGSASFERHIEDANNTSWIVFTNRKSETTTIGNKDYLLDTFGYYNRTGSGWKVYHTIWPSNGLVYGCNCSPLYYEFDTGTNLRQVWQLPKEQWKTDDINAMASFQRYNINYDFMSYGAKLYSNNTEPLNSLTSEMPVFIFDTIYTIAENDATLTATSNVAYGMVIPLPSCYSTSDRYDGQDHYITPNNPNSGEQEEYAQNYLQLEDTGYNKYTLRLVFKQNDNTFIFGDTEPSGKRIEQYIQLKTNDTLEIYYDNNPTYHTIEKAVPPETTGSWTITVNPPLPAELNSVYAYFRDRKSLLGNANHPAYGRLRYEHFKLSINNTFQVQTVTTTRYRLLGCNYNRAATNQTLIGSQMATKKQEIPDFPGIYAGAVYGVWQGGTFYRSGLIYGSQVVPYVEFRLQAQYWSVVDQITGLWRQAVPGDTITGITYGDNWITYRCGIEDHTNYTYNLAIKENYKNNIWWQGITKTLL